MLNGWWFLLVAFGAGGTASLLRYNLRRVAAVLGGSNVSLGLLGVAGSFYGFEGQISEAIIIAWVFSLVVTILLTFRNFRALFFLVFPAFLLIRAFIPSIPLLVLFASMTMLVILIDSFDFSRVDITTCIKDRGGGLNVTLVPFSKLEIFVRNASNQEDPKSRVLLIYIGFLSIGLIGSSLIAYSLSGEIILGDVLLLLGLTYLGIAREGYAKARPDIGD